MADELRDLYRPDTFMNFYHGEWDDILHTVQIPSMEGASWDRRAAYLLWTERGGAPNLSVEDSFAKKALPKKVKAIPAPVEEEDDDNWSHLV